MAEYERRLLPGGENLRAVKCMYFTAMLLLGAAGGDGLRGRGRWERGRRRRLRGKALVSDGLDDLWADMLMQRKLMNWCMISSIAGQANELIGGQAIYFVFDKK